MSNKNPLNRKATVAEVDALFGSRANSRLAQQIRRDDPATYFRVREQAEADGKVGPASYVTPAEREELTRPKGEQGKSKDVLLAMAKHSREDCRGFLNGDPNKPNPNVPIPAKLHATDPAAYAEWILACQGHGIVGQRNMPEVVVVDHSPKSDVPKPTEERRMGILPEFAKMCGLPLDYQATEREVLDLLEVKAKLLQEKLDAESKQAQEETEPKVPA